MAYSLLTDAQRYALAIIRHISGCISLCASSIIIYHVILRYREQKLIQERTNLVTSSKRVTPYHRLLLGISIMDVMYSFWAGLSTIPVPASSGVIYGFGTIATCSAQGMFTQLAAAIPIYMAILSAYFMFKIRYNMSDDYFSRRLEVWLHLIPWLFAIGTGLMGVFLQVFNPISIPEMGCWLGSYPSDCLWTGEPCTRGYKFQELVNFYAIFFAHGWIFTSFFIIVICNILIYTAIRAQEQRNERYYTSRLQQSVMNHFVTPSARSSTTVHVTIDDHRSSTIHREIIAAMYEENEHATEHDESSNPTTTTHDNSETTQDHDRCINSQTMKASRSALVQSLLYVSTSFLTAMWIFLPFFALKMGLTNINWRYFFAFMLNGFVPIQGVFNLIIYVRLQYLRRRLTDRNRSRWSCIVACLFHPDFNDPVLNKRRRASLRLSQVQL